MFLARSVSLRWAHVNSDRVEAAYRRTDLFDRRRELMEAMVGIRRRRWRELLYHAEQHDPYVG